MPPADNGVVTLTSFISPYRADRERVRGRMHEGGFLEIYMKVRQLAGIQNLAVHPAVLRGAPALSLVVFHCGGWLGCAWRGLGRGTSSARDALG